MRVNRRVFLATLAGLLLPLPLMLMLAGLMIQPSQVQPSGRARISPVLTIEQRQLLQTYHRDCTQRSDCEPPLGCLSDIRVAKHYCADSECVTDMQCPDGFACRPLPTVGGGPLVRYCIPPGVRKEGERCLSIPSTQDEACEPGLLCSAGWCGRPCQTDTPTSCPEGFFCSDTIPQPACRPTCEGRTCPEGQQCIQDKEGASACVVVHGPNCQSTPCSDGRKCMALFGSRNVGHVWMECFPECGADRPACPEGLTCYRTRCLKPCEPEGPDVCEPGYRCQRLNDKQPWLCRPDM